MGRPVTEVNSDEGIYIDEEGNVFQLGEKGRSKPMEIEQSASERDAAGADAQASANGRTPKDGKASPISLNSKARLTTMSAALAGQTSPSSQLFAAYSNRASYISDTRAVPGPYA